MDGEYFLTARDPGTGAVTAHIRAKNAVTQVGMQYVAGFLAGRLEPGHLYLVSHT